MPVPWVDPHYTSLTLVKFHLSLVKVATESLRGGCCLLISNFNKRRLYLLFPQNGGHRHFLYYIQNVHGKCEGTAGH